MKKTRATKPRTMTWLRSMCSQSGECLLWKGPTNKGGYPQTHDKQAYRAGKKQTMLVRRLVYGMKNGPIPEGARLMMTCGNRLCLNPAHIRPASYRETAAAAAAAGAWKTPRSQIARKLQIAAVNIRRGIAAQPLPQSSVFAFAGAA